MILHLMERQTATPRPLCLTRNGGDIYSRSFYSFTLAVIDRVLGRTEEPHGCRDCQSLVRDHY